MRSLFFRSALRGLPLALLALSACYDEGLEIHDLVGEVVIPASAATRELPFPQFNDDGTPQLDGTGTQITAPETVTDVKLIGPVYIGLYPGTEVDVFEGFRLPVREPFRDIALPYGGTTVGDFRNPCIESLVCRVTSGRFVDFDEMVDWFNTQADAPITDAEGNTIVVGDFIRQTCFENLEYTADEEIRLTVTQDRNGDGALNEMDLDFVYDEGRDAFVGSFEMLNAEFFPGMHAWAYMDSPGLTEYGFDSCNDVLGFFENTYDNDYQAGLQFNDILNVPDQRIESGDWVITEEVVWTDPERPVTLVIDQQVTSGGDQ